MKKKEKPLAQPVDTKKRNIVFLLDETGSMNSCASDTIGGFNAFIEKQLKEKNDILFSLTLFNSGKIERRYVNEPIENVEKLSSDNYSPDKLTPLWDAIGTTIRELKDVDETLFIILTDGLENVSKEYNAKSIKNLIKEKEEKGWQFLFLGADLESFEDAQSVDLKNVAKYSKGDSLNAFRSISNTVSTYYSTGKVDYDLEESDEK